MSDTYGQGCPIAVALDAIGDRWTLLLLRDLAHAPMRYSDLQAINPRISPNLLSKRLRQLQDAGLVAKRGLPPPAAATVYELRPEARAAVLPVLNALGRFGAYLFQADPAGPADVVLGADQALVCSRPPVGVHVSSGVPARVRRARRASWHADGGSLGRRM